MTRSIDDAQDRYNGGYRLSVARNSKELPASVGSIGPGAQRLILDISLTREHERRPAVGILRVEREIARAMLKTQNAVFVFFDHRSQCFRRVEQCYVHVLLSIDDQTSVGQDDLASGLPYGLRFVFGPDDILICCGLSWDRDVLPVIYRMKQRTAFRHVQILYDLIPTIYPEYCVPGMRERFPKFLLDAAWTSDAVYCISNSTLVDFVSYIERVAAPTPAILRRLVMGVDRLGPAVSKAPSSRMISDLSSLVGCEGFVVYVSTIEPRKNHALLLNVWRALEDELGDAIPALVFIGQPGWNSENLVYYARESELYRSKKLFLIENVQDSELAWLYSNCRFTVYPSLYEGWGLPISESIAYGKVCIASTSSSMPEASQGLMPLLHPLDFQGWLDRCRELILSPQLLDESQAAVLKGSVLNPWETCAVGFIDDVSWLFRARVEHTAA